MYINNLDPVAIRVFGFEIWWYSLAYIFGILISIQYGKLLIKKNNFFSFQSSKLDDYLPYAIAGIIIGGRLGYVIFYDLIFFIKNPLEIIFIWRGGMSFHGALIGVIIGTHLFANKRNIQTFILLDVIACVSPLGIFLGRIANFINGELVGKITSVPWGVIFPAIDKFQRHPSQIYEAILEGLILFILMIYLASRREALKFPGFLAGVFFIGYGLARCFVELFRQPDAQFQSQNNPLGFFIQMGEFGLTMGQILSIPMIFIGFVLCFTSWRNKTA